MDNSSANDAGIFDNSTALTGIWVCAAIFFLVCPLLMSSNRRKLCNARIRQRRWNAGQNHDWYREASERLEERSRNRSQDGLPTSLTIEEEEEIRQLFLIHQLSQFTMTISSDDIKMKSDAEEKALGDDSSERKNDIETGSIGPVAKPVKEDDEDTDSCSDEFVVEFEQSDRIVTVIVAGESVWPLDQTHKTRDVANGCAVCLCEFDSQDQITWAANKECPHVFHSDCILQWMLALGRKEQKRLRRHPQWSTGDPLKDIITFPMLCPCCRQQFINKPEDIPSLTPESTGLNPSNSTEESAAPETSSAEETPATETRLPPPGDENATSEAAEESQP
jgi:hypothetical protein